MNATRVIGIAMCVMGCLAVAPAPARADFDGEWKVIATTGSEPSARGVHGAVRVGNRMYVFGGFLERDNQPPSTVPDFYEFYNDLYYLDTEANVWTALTPSGPLPGVRAFHRLMVDESDPDGIYLFGGTKYLNSSTPLPLTYGDVWRYDIGDNAWTELTPNLSNCPTPPALCVPSARLGMAGAMHEGKIYIFGGLEVSLQPFSLASRGDTWRFDVATQTWTQLAPTGDVPSPRHFVASSNYGQNKMVTYAGQTPPGPAWSTMAASTRSTSRRTFGSASSTTRPGTRARRWSGSARTHSSSTPARKGFPAPACSPTSPKRP